jgi:hypothetical protein
VRHCLAKLLGSCQVPAVDGKIVACPPKYGRLRRTANICRANRGSATVRNPASDLAAGIHFSPSRSFSRIAVAGWQWLRTLTEQGGS